MTKSAIRVGILLCICVAQLCKATGPSISVEIDPSLDQNAMAVWLAYLLAREQYHIEHALPVPTSGEIVPPFEEEVAARKRPSKFIKS